ncbi:MAG: DUF814 domain-containing protein [Bacteroidetes bacterium]|nr:MAG: DUF814 domain-containing protein [Bacteroidota bacterium]
MPVHYFTLRLLADEFHQNLQHATITEIFTQQKNELCFIASTPACEYALCVSLEPRFHYCILREGFSRAKKNSVDLFQQAIGKAIERVWMQPGDRILALETDGSMTFYIQLYNTAASNIVLVDSMQNVLSAFKREKQLLGSIFTSRQRHETEIGMNEASLMDLIREGSQQTAQEFLKTVSPMFGALYSRETLFRSGVGEHEVMGEVAEEKRLTFVQTIMKVTEESRKGTPMLYHKEGAQDILSVIQLEHCGDMSLQRYESMNEAVSAFLTHTFHKRWFEARKREYSGKISGALENSKRAILAIRKELASAERATEYEHAGHTIMANLHTIEKGMSKIELPDIFDDQSTVTIQMERALSPHQNAERYFEKARKAKQARVEAEERLVREQERMTALEAMMEELKNCRDDRDMKSFVSRYERGTTPRDALNDDSRIPFRVFTVAGGYEVWVGKSSSNNDLLTMKYAKPNDLWFHARGVGGSHTLLRVPGGKIAPPKEAIIQAARIAAYYSKMRKNSNVPVSYCERKFIRKPKHAAAGAVMLEREEVLFVEPLLP